MRGLGAQSSGQAPLPSEVVGSILATNVCEVSVNADSAISRGFLRVLFPAGKLIGRVRINI